MDVKHCITCASGTDALLMALMALDIYCSSASVYGDAVEVSMTEDHPFNNKNFYGATKISGEAMCTAYNDRYSLNVIGLRST